MVSGVGHVSDKEKTMSLYDTLRCLKHDPAFLLELHADKLAGIGVVTVLLLWGAL